MTEQEQALLSLGPNFALCPKVDERFINQVDIEIAACAYRLRWSQCISKIHSCPSLLQHFQRQGAPIQKPFANPPPISNSDNEDNLKELNKFIVNLVRNTNLKSNLTANQRAGLKSLLDKRDLLSITVSDKGGEFVVLPIRCQQDLTDHHLNNTGGVYKFVAPTRRYQGTFQPIMNPTETSYRRQISSLADRLQSKCNTLWKKICSERSLGVKVERAFITTKSSLHAMYVLLKTQVCCT